MGRILEAGFEIDFRYSHLIIKECFAHVASIGAFSKEVV